MSHRRTKVEKRTHPWPVFGAQTMMVCGACALIEVYIVLHIAKKAVGWLP